MTDVGVQPLGPPRTFIQAAVARVLAPDYTSSAKLVVDQTFIGRVTQCMTILARKQLEAARDAGFNPPEIAMSIDVATATPTGLAMANQRVVAAVALIAADPAFAQAYANGPPNNQQAGVTDAQILTAIQYLWHPLAVGMPGG